MEPAEGEFQFQGKCIGGPLDGQEVSSRFIRGFILINRGLDLCWIYDYDEKLSSFNCRNADGEQIDHARRFTTASGTEFDVRAVA